MTGAKISESNSMHKSSRSSNADLINIGVYSKWNGELK